MISMKYGLIYYRNTTNIGDDILSYAGKRFLPRTDYFIDREEMDVFIPEEREYVAAILNGWYLHYSYAFPPSPYLLPLFTGTHFNRDTTIFGDYSYLDGNVTDYLRKNGPVGGRDTQTVKILSEKGIDSYYSGCLTLTLPKYDDVQPSHAIILTDVSDEIVSYVQTLLPDKNIIRRTHNLKPEDVGADWPEREARVEAYLKDYQAADLVITTRLHCALPSAALGTPVILVGRFDEDYYDRLKDFAEYCACYSEEDILNGKAQEAICRPAGNKSIRPLADKITECCRNFIYRTSHEKYDISQLPEPALYKELFVERTQHMRRALNKLIGIRYSLEKQHVQDTATMERVLAAAQKLLNMK